MNIQAVDVEYSVDHIAILSDVNITCSPGQTIALTGPSGSGKTTLLGILGLLINPSGGNITIGHARKWSNRRRRIFWRDEAAFIYQDYGILDDEKISYNVTLKRESFLSRGKARTKLDSILETVSLAGRGNERAKVLSGGEKQRVGIARALWKQANFIFADEPTASLDHGNKHRIESLLFAAAEKGACVIIATHDDELIQMCSQRYDLVHHTGGLRKES